jgi:GDP-4-dehydro-6-deoxy-D-mannose reductase
MRAFVTGDSGFVGQWLCRALLRDGWDVVGFSLDLSRPLDSEAELPLDAVDAALDAILATPTDAVFHLAGVSSLPAAAADAQSAMSVNVGGAVRVLQAMHRAKTATGAAPVMLVVGSGEEYGRHDESELPLAERAACRPATPYGLSKWMQERVALTMAADLGLRVIATRSFNHSGPGQAPGFLLPSLVQRAVAARAAGGEVVIGNTDVIRDFLHVEDVVSAYISLVSRGISGEVYNVCSGHGVRVGELAQEVLAAAGVRAPLKVDPALQRAVDVPVLVGDNAKLRSATGWAPRIARSRIISDLLDAAS